MDCAGKAKVIGNGRTRRIVLENWFDRQRKLWNKRGQVGGDELLLEMEGKKRFQLRRMTLVAFELENMETTTMMVNQLMKECIVKGEIWEGKKRGRITCSKTTGKRRDTRYE